MMRSQYASEDEDTYVIYTFSYQDEIYTIRRNPEYTRLSKRRYADGSLRYVRESASVELTLPDGQVFRGKKRETDQKIVQIIGLDVHQFTQIAMIAQGDFLKLLLAESKERKKIFSKIFQTGLYYRVQETLKREAGNLYQCVEENIRDTKREMERVICDIDTDENAENSHRWKELCEMQMAPEAEVTKILHQMIDMGEEKEKAAKRAVGDMQDILKLSDAYQKSLSEREDIKKRLEKINSDYEEVLKRDENLKNEVSVQKELYEESECKYRPEIIRLTDALPMYEQLDFIKDTLTKLRSEQVIREQKLDAKVLDVERLELQTEKLRQISELYADSGHKVEMINARIDRQKEQQIEWENLKAEQDELAELKERCEKKRRQAESDRSDYMQKLLSYERMYQAFLDAQAGILAESLKKGMPCPVCGSLEHPDICRRAEHAPTQAEVERAKAERDQAESKRNTSAEQFRELAGRYRAGKESYFRRYESARTALTDGNVEDITGIQAALDVIGTQISHLKDEARKLIAAASACEKARRDLKEKEQNLETTKAELKRLEMDLTDIRLEVKEQEARYQERAENLPLSSKEAAVGRLKDLNRTVTESKEKYEQLFLKGQESQESIKHIEGQQKSIIVMLDNQKQLCEENRKSLIEKIKDLSARMPEDVENIESLAAFQNEWQQKCTDLQEKQLQIYSANHRNREIYKLLQKLFVAGGTLRKQYEVLSNLSKTANGNLNGAVKLDFETYVQRQYFRQIIQAANKRLIQMNSGEFILQCRDVQNLGSHGQAGLDLDIYHMAGNTVRDVKTLSGGESFMASLSMALGLADIVQNTAGAIHLDTMFVDEGFGSLDDASREQAIRVLNELADERHLVGIISHVNELKEQIDCKLIVTKTETGSKIHWSI